MLFEAPWSVMGHLLVVQPLEAGKSESELEFQWSPFWVQAHGLPVAKLTRRNGEIIEQQIGKLIGGEAMHDGLLLERSFLRMRVNVDTSNLSPGVFSSTKTHPRAATPKSSGFPTNSRNSLSSAMIVAE